MPLLLLFKYLKKLLCLCLALISSVVLFFVSAWSDTVSAMPGTLKYAAQCFGSHYEIELRQNDGVLAYEAFYVDGKATNGEAAFFSDVQTALGKFSSIGPLYAECLALESGVGITIEGPAKPQALKRISVFLIGTHEELRVFEIDCEQSNPRADEYGQFCTSYSETVTEKLD